MYIKTSQSFQLLPQIPAILSVINDAWCWEQLWLYLRVQNGWCKFLRNPWGYEIRGIMTNGSILYEFKEAASVSQTTAGILCIFWEFWIIMVKRTWLIDKVCGKFRKDSCVSRVSCRANSYFGRSAFCSYFERLDDLGVGVYGFPFLLI